ncbi:MAG: hypothetical protein OWQ57_08505 [Sulfobacillus sp.]|nr:hypothetical protein [Sulfobacillus sp.]
MRYLEIRRIVALLRMIVGSVMGIVGFGTLSLGFVQLSGGTMGLGVLEILAGTFLALGVMAPLRVKRSHR